jgi:hypothetical protein
VDLVPDPLHFFYLVVPGIEPGPTDLQPRTLTTRPQRRSGIFHTLKAFKYVGSGFASGDNKKICNGKCGH